jgi:hypothetical protein
VGRNRFIIAAIIQGGIVTAMGLVTLAFQLLTTGIDIIEFLSISFEGPAKWFFIGIILYLILIIAIPVTAVFYNHLEINLKKQHNFLLLWTGSAVKEIMEIMCYRNCSVGT